MSIYAFMGSYVMNALDYRKVITVDIPITFLQGNWPQNENTGYITLTGIIAEMNCKIYPSYYKNVIWSKDCTKKFIYS